MEPYKLLLLGRSHTDYGSFVCRLLNDGSTACSLSVGSDPASPSLAAKGDAAQPNEDALFAVDDGTFCLAAVADAHYGDVSGHRLLELLAARVVAPIPTPRALNDVVTSLADEGATASPSATTLVVVTYDRQRRRGFGMSYGDSSCVRVGDDGFEALNERSIRFVSPARPRSLALDNANCFEFGASPGDLVVVFTDGIDECHYGRPETSVRPGHLQSLHASSSGDPEHFVTTLTELALRGVDGNPGGQDNIALIAMRA